MIYCLSTLHSHKLTTITTKIVIIVVSKVDRQPSVYFFHSLLCFLHNFLHNDKTLIYHRCNDYFFLAHYCSCHLNNAISHFKFEIRLGRWRKVWMIFKDYVRKRSEILCISFHFGFCFQTQLPLTVVSEVPKIPVLARNPTHGLAQFKENGGESKLVRTTRKCHKRDQW